MIIIYVFACLLSMVAQTYVIKTPVINAKIVLLDQL